jgi:hypothetical protein
LWSVEDEGNQLTVLYILEHCDNLCDITAILGLKDIELRGAVPHQQCVHFVMGMVLRQSSFVATSLQPCQYENIDVQLGQKDASFEEELRRKIQIFSLTSAEFAMHATAPIHCTENAPFGSENF